MKLHLGCGRNLLPEWVNIDQNFPWGHNPPPEGTPTFVRYNLDGAARKHMPWPDNSVDEVYCAHTIEHLHNPLPMMQELWRVCKPGAMAVFETPHGSSDDAFEDPTHVRQMFPGSWGFFGQPFYWRADYGYRGDWQVREVQLEVSGQLLQSVGEKGMIPRITHGRNFVVQMRAFLECIKPMRLPSIDLQEPTNVVLVPVRVHGWLPGDESVDRLTGPHLAPNEDSTESDNSSEQTEQGSTNSLRDPPGADY